MAKVATNLTSLTAVLESTAGTAPTSGWFLLEPNPGTLQLDDEVTTTAREPVSADRQNRKGVPTDKNAGLEFEQDLTVTALDKWVEAFAYAEFHNADMTYIAADVDSSGYTIPAASANEAGKWQYTSGGPISLAYAQGYANSGNNGLKPLTSDLATSGTTLPVTGLTTETAPANARVEIAGIRPETGDLSLTVSGSTGSLTSGNNGATNNIDFTTLGLTVGQFIHIGGLTSGEQFSAGAGYARITAIAAGQLDLDKLDSTLATDTGASETVDLLFGRFLRNVAVTADSDDERYVERSYHFEVAYPDLGGVGTDEYEYATAMRPNVFTFNLPLTSKSTFSTSFIGNDIETPTSSRKTGASSAEEPLLTTAFSTAGDIPRINLSSISSAGDTCFKSLTFTIDNGLTPEKCLGTLGNVGVNQGRFNVNFEGQALFTTNQLISDIRNNTTLTFDFRVANDEGCICFDIPSMTMTGGGREFPQNETVRINLTGNAFKDDDFGTSLGISFFPVCP